MLWKIVEVKKHLQSLVMQLRMYFSVFLIRTVHIVNSCILYLLLNIFKLLIHTCRAIHLTAYNIHTGAKD